MPQGGTFSIPSPYSGLPVNFSYTVTNASGCSATETARLQYYEVPVAQILIPSTTLPVDYSPLNLEANLPGTFSGEGVIDNVFYPALAGEGGPYAILFRHITINGCVIQDSVLFSVTGPCEVPQEDTRIVCKESKYRPGDIIHLEIINAGSMNIQWSIPSGYKMKENNGSEISLYCGGEPGTVSALLQNGCGKTFELTSMITPENLSLDVYLSNQEIVCVIKGMHGCEGDLKIYSTTGQLTNRYPLSDETIRIPVGNYVAGIYNLMLESCGMQLIKKIIINR
jgi:hypothetical protein